MTSLIKIKRLNLILFLPKKKLLKSNNTKNHIWITATKIKIPVRKMTTLHIQNCIACWEGVGLMEIPNNYLGGKEKWLKIFNQELINRQ